jgi:hypothetical protein
VGVWVKRLIGIIRAPARFVLLVIEHLWNLVVNCMAIGAVFVLWDMLNADWTPVALSQQHPRKRVRLKINRRL